LPLCEGGLFVKGALKQKSLRLEAFLVTRPRGLEPLKAGAGAAAASSTAIVRSRPASPIGGGATRTFVGGRWNSGTPFDTVETMARSGRLLVVTALAALAIAPAAASARGWHWSRHYTFMGSTATAHGHTCAASRFSDWRWSGRARINGDTYTFRWIERIRDDGRFRALNYTYVNSTAWSEYSAAERRAIRNAVITGLERTRVGWLEQTAGREYLQYRVGSREEDPVRWRPQQGC
jgi:hypothetical protein